MLAICQGKETAAYIYRVAPLILMAVTIEHNIHSSSVQDILHGQPHALILLVVRCVYIRYAFMSLKHNLLYLISDDGLHGAFSKDTAASHLHTVSQHHKAASMTAQLHACVG